MSPAIVIRSPVFQGGFDSEIISSSWNNKASFRQEKELQPGIGRCLTSSGAIKQRLEDPAESCDGGYQVCFSSTRPCSRYGGLVMSKTCLWLYGASSWVGRQLVCTQNHHPIRSYWLWSSDLLRSHIRWLKLVMAVGLCNGGEQGLVKISQKNLSWVFVSFPSRWVSYQLSHTWWWPLWCLSGDNWRII